MSIQGGPDIVNDGLILHIDAANNRSYVSGSTTWFDLSGNADNSGSLLNGPIYSTDNGGSIIFDGTNDTVYVRRELSTLGTNSVTVNIWSKINVSDVTFRYLFHTGRFSSFHLGYTDGKMFSRLSGVPSDSGNIYNFPVYGTTTLPLNAWVMTTVVMDRSSDIKLYLNGKVEPTSASVNISSANGVYFDGAGSYAVSIGSGKSNRNTPLEFHQGNISLVQLYFRALSAEEVRQNYNATKGRFGL